MVKIGMVIGDRYEIQELIGTGGMSDVYRARCNKLNRVVAVKVLKQEFSENREFVAKFRREAEAAANLMHPNIVTVYDVGEDNGISYIVMELVDGYTLKEYIEKKSRLAINECISIAIPIASGIEAAHNKNIIHRDIKPQNVIISKDGKVKVTDFGIAKTTTSNTISSNVMGSVHYTSPEQARGGFSDEKSDIYSLGITLFEMVTGRVPFNGDTTVAIAIKHIQEEMPSPRIYVEDIPISIEQIILKCTQKSPDRRYQKMSEVIEDLKKAYISPNENFVKIDTYEQNSVTKTNLAPIYERSKRNYDDVNTSDIENDERIIRNSRKHDENLELPPNVKKEDRRQADSNQNRKPSRNPQNPERRKTQGNNTQGQTSSAPKKNTSKNAPSKSKPLPAKKKPSSRKKDDTSEKIKTFIIGAVAVIIGLLFLLLLFKLVGTFDTNKNKEKFVGVPSVTNMNYNSAITYLENAKLEYEIVYEHSDDVTVNRVIRTSPSAGTSVVEGTKVTVVVCADEEGIKIPSVVGKSESEATSKLEGDGFKVKKDSEMSQEYDKGMVIRQIPEADAKVSYGSEVTIVISSGSSKEKNKMPDLTGKTEEEARQIVADLGMKVTSVSNDTYSDTVEEGKVCWQSYTVNSVIKEGAEVTLKLSIGPEPRYYNCNIVVQAPEKYTGGPATVVLKTVDGSTELFHESAPVFPLNINISGIYGVSKGKVEVIYTVNQSKETQNPDGTVSIENVPVEEVVSYEVDFQ